MLIRRVYYEHNFQMKIIVSHDIDHLSFWEHRADLILPKSLLRALIELGNGSISIKECMLRYSEVFSKRMHYLPELMDFNSKHRVPATFFMGMDNALGLNYSKEDAAPWIRKIIENGFDVGVHGIAFDSLTGLKKEFSDFKLISGLENFGVRMHYLRQDKNTLFSLEQAGYVFDSTEYKNEGPFKIGGMWEFPLHIMDSYMIQNGKAFQHVSLEAIKKKTKEKMELIQSLHLPYLTLLFHDRYYCDAYGSWKEWYEWCILYLKKEGFEFISYQNAIKELEKG